MDIPNYAPFRHPVPSKSDQKVLALFGTGFEDLDNADDAVSKKPTAVENQIVTDEQGRRRFHGAFTGGFSAGYYMTVGSEKGWTPAEFKSSRSERADKHGRKPEDFMDDEDLGEYGILPRKIKTSERFSEKKGKDGEKRKLAWEHSQLSHEADKLADLIKPVTESVGMRLLSKMGWRAGKGVGPDIKKTEKAPKRKAYGCSLPGQEEEMQDDEEEGVSTIPANFQFAPEDIALVRLEGKQDMHGLGYRGLDSNSLAAVIKKSTAVKRDRKQGKGISGQAFGVGAFEEEDADVFGDDDLNEYDFTLGGPSTSAPHSVSISSDFVAGSLQQNARRFFPPPRMPRDFKPTHTPMPCAVSEDISKEQLKTLGQCLRLNPLQRAQLLGEKHSVMTLISEQDKKRIDEAKKKIEDARKKYQKSEPTGDVKPERDAFRDDPAKRKLFDEFIMYLRRGLTMPQPVHMTEWEWETLEAQFMKNVPDQLKDSLYESRANQLPLASPHISTPFAHLLKSKFMKAKTEDDQEDNTAPKGQEHEDKVQAVKLKLFGAMTREKFEWHPHRVLCRRMNIPEPYPESNAIGVASLQRSKLSGHDLMMGLRQLPSTSFEMQNKRELAEKNRGHSVKQEEEEKIGSAPLPEEPIAMQPEPLELVSVERPPLDLFKSIFTESTDEEESEHEDEPPPPPVVPPPIISHSASIVKAPLLKQHQPQPHVKLETKRETELIDLGAPDPVPIIHSYGPSLPPEESDIKVLPTTSTIQRLKDSSNLKEKKSRKHKKEKKKKSKKGKHKSSKKKKQYSSSTEEISSDSEDEWQEKKK